MMTERSELAEGTIHEDCDPELLVPRWESVSDYLAGEPPDRLACKDCGEAGPFGD